MAICEKEKPAFGRCPSCQDYVDLSVLRLRYSGTKWSRNEAEQGAASVLRDWMNSP